jgi:hypothetical protein
MDFGRGFLRTRGEISSGFGELDGDEKPLSEQSFGEYFRLAFDCWEKGDGMVMTADGIAFVEESDNFGRRGD